MGRVDGALSGFVVVVTALMAGLGRKHGRRIDCAAQADLAAESRRDRRVPDTVLSLRDCLYRPDGV
jgi:hypothetical protein